MEEKFEKGFPLKTHQMFSVHIMRKNLKTQQSRAGKLYDYSDAIVYENLRSQTFSVHTKTKSRFFQIPPVWSFRKAPFS